MAEVNITIVGIDFNEGADYGDRHKTKFDEADSVLENGYGTAEASHTHFYDGKSRTHTLAGRV
jgi:hypothetical protein